MANTAVTAYLSSVTEVIRGLDAPAIEAFVADLSAAREHDKQVFLFGNGGSGATASHMACDLNKGASYGMTKRFRVLCLNDNMATLSAYANDVSYADIFVEPLKNFLCPGDLVIGISGSGNSENVLRAIRYANEQAAITWGLCGYAGGALKALAQRSVHVAVDDMQHTEDIHLMIGHIAMQTLCQRDGVACG